MKSVILFIGKICIFSRGNQRIMDMKVVLSGIMGITQEGISINRLFGLTIAQKDNGRVPIDHPRKDNMNIEKTGKVITLTNLLS